MPSSIKDEYYPQKIIPPLPSPVKETRKKKKQEKGFIQYNKWFCFTNISFDLLIFRSIRIAIKKKKEKNKEESVGFIFITTAMPLLVLLIHQAFQQIKKKQCWSKHFIHFVPPRVIIITGCLSIYYSISTIPDNSICLLDATDTSCSRN